MNLRDTSHHIVSSTVGTVSAELATIPICTLKTFCQNTEKISLNKAIVSIYRERGIRGFYSASAASICSQTLTSCSKYVSYRVLNNHIDSKILCGFISGVLMTPITHPIDVCRVHLQMGSKIPFHSPSLMYRGYTKTISKSLVGSVLFLPIYDVVKEYSHNSFISGISSAVISSTIIHPLDLLKTRHMFGQSLIPSNWKPISIIKFYYRGLALNLMRIVPHFTIMMSTIDFVYNKLR